MLSIAVRESRSWHIRRLGFNTIRTHSRTLTTTPTLSRMGKNNKKRNNIPDEKYLLLPVHSTTATTPVIDTHTHLLSTFSWYRSKYGSGRFSDLFEFVRGVYHGHNIKAIVDVWCEPPMPPVWKELADSALSPEDRTTKWGGVDYWFVMGKLFFHRIHVSR